MVGAPAMRMTGHGPGLLGLSIALVLGSATAAAQPLAMPPEGAAQPEPAAPESAEPESAEPESMGAQSAAEGAGEAGAAPAGPPATPQVLLEQRVEVHPGATCIDRERLLRRIERWLERETVDQDVYVVVRGDERDEYEVVFTVQKGPGTPSERRIADAPEECGQLHAAVALSIALAIDAAIAEAEVPAVELPEDEELVAPPEPPAPPYLRVALGLQGQASSSVLTGVALGGTARFELGFVPWLDLRAGVLGGAISHERIGSIEGTFSAELLAGRLDACAVFDAASKARLLACAGALVGRFRTAGQDFSPSRDQSELWAAAALGAEVQVETLSWLDIALSVDVVLPTASRTIQAVDTDGEPQDARTISKAGVLVGVGPVFQFF